MKYLLPCSCGQKNTVEKSQAGQTILCSCGAELAVPALRGLSQLEQADDATTLATHRESNWSPLQGSLFSLGLLIIFIAGPIGGFYLYKSSLIRTTDEEMNITDRELRDKLDSHTYSDALQAWEVMRAYGLGNYEDSYFVRARAEVARLRTRAAIAAGVAALGLLLAAASFFLVPKNATAR